MTTLTLLRHAKAVAEDPGGDPARPLAGRGRRASRAVATWMAHNRLEPELVLCSSALRTRETLALLLPAWRPLPTVLYEDALYLAGPDRILARLREVPPRTASVLLVGHNPGLQELAVQLADGRSAPQAKLIAANFPTAALASFELPADWASLARGGARLTVFITPKEIAAEGD